MFKSLTESVTFAVDRHTKVPLFRQIYDRTRAAIADGRLRPGERLPSARSLAAQLGASRGTVEAAYALLGGEGWIVARGASGTMVTPRLGQQQVLRWALPHETQRGAGTIGGQPVVPRPFRMGLPALDAFPRAQWSRLVAHEARGLSASRLDYPDPAGDAGLREAVAAYLAIARGIPCMPEQVFITSGYRGALNIVARALIAPGTSVWIEDPGYHMASLALAACGAHLVPVPVDGDGMRVEEAIGGPIPARFAVVTPAHQSPLGVALSLPRRLALLAWAEANAAWIIEDDYDGEFHYTGRPLPALKSLDHADVVLYAGSFSKVLFPGLRLGYLVVPKLLVQRFAAATPLFGGGCSRLEQSVVTHFMAEGHFARHLKRMRSLYASRRATLAATLADVFGDRLEINLQSGGMHLLVRPTGSTPDVQLVQLAEREGLAPSALSTHALAADCGSGLLLSFTNIPEEQAQQVALTFFRAIGEHLRPT